jgi:hypothetical protein
MPLLGTLDIQQWAASGIAVYEGKDDEPWVLQNTESLQLSIEIQPQAQALLPPAMHPAIPMYMVCSITRCPDTPVGPFTLAQVLIAGRIGIRPRGFVLKSLVDREAARRELAARWGFPVFPGESRVWSQYDRVRAEVRTGGAVSLACELTDREPIEGVDIEPLACANVARSGSEDKLVLIQVEPHYEYHKAERGRPRLLSFDQTVWKTGGQVQFAQSIAATYLVSDIMLPPPRYIIDPEQPSSQMPKRTV